MWYHVVDGQNKVIYGPTTEGDAQAYVTESSVVCDTSRWDILPIEIEPGECK